MLRISHLKVLRTFKQLFELHFRFPHTLATRKIKYETIAQKRTAMNQLIKKVIKPFYHFFLIIGFDPRRIFSLRHYPKYRTQYKYFQKLGGVITHKYAIFPTMTTKQAQQADIIFIKIYL